MDVPRGRDQHIPRLRDSSVNVAAARCLCLTLGSSSSPDRRRTMTTPAHCHLNHPSIITFSSGESSSWPVNSANKDPSDHARNECITMCRSDKEGMMVASYCHMASHFPS
ncbi:hypothetical protein VTH06DRAFT_5356 [Thermothelomyces fergusii]